MQKMKEKKRLYKKAKRLQSESAWSAYRLLKTQSLKKLELPMPSLCDSNTDTQHKKFWRCIKSQWKANWSCTTPC